MAQINLDKPRLAQRSLLWQIEEYCSGQQVAANVNRYRTGVTDSGLNDGVECATVVFEFVTNDVTSYAALSLLAIWGGNTALGLRHLHAAGD